MKKEKIIISLCVIFTALVELASFYATQSIAQIFIEKSAGEGLLLSFVFAVDLLVIYGLILPKVFFKYSINPHLVFKVFLIFNIVFNIFSGVIGIYTYLYFVVINPNVMFLNLIIEDFYSRIDLFGNILYYFLLIAVTFVKPLLLKCFLKIESRRRNKNMRENI